MWHSASGKLVYGPGIRAIIEIDQGIVDFYQSLIPSYHHIKPSRYSAHLTVVRTEKDKPTKLEHWNKYPGEIIEYQYQDQVLYDGTYWYLNAKSSRIAEIREELGLPQFRKSGCYHITLGNSKDDD